MLYRYYTVVLESILKINSRFYLLEMVHDIRWIPYMLHEINGSMSLPAILEKLTQDQAFRFALDARPLIRFLS